MLKQTNKDFFNISKSKCSPPPREKKYFYVAKLIKEEKYPKMEEECPPLQETCVWETNYLKKKPLLCYPYYIKKE